MAPRTDPPAGFWQREVSHMPKVLTPMARTTIVDAANTGFRAMFDDLSLFIETFEFGVVDGWGYVRVVPFGGKDGPLPPQAVMRVITRVHPGLRRRIRACETAVADKRFIRWMDDWFTDVRPRLIGRRQRLLGVCLADLEDDALAEHLQATRSLLQEALAVHAYVHGTNALVLGDLVFRCRDDFGWDETEALELCSGLSGASTAPGAALAELARIADERPAVRSRLTADPPDPASLLAADPVFADAFTRYQDTYCHRTIRYDPADFTLFERPELTLRLVRDQLERRFDDVGEAVRAKTVREERLVAAGRALAGRSRADRERFKEALRQAWRFYPIREERGFHTINGPLAVLRYAVLEAGRRLVERGVVEHPDDAFLFEFEELRDAVRKHLPAAGLLATRSADLERQRRIEAPLSYGADPGPPPSFAFLPPAARFANEAMAWVLDRNFAPDTSRLRQPPGPKLSGFGASRGTYVGPARLVLSESDFHRVEPGDVLVCPITAPPWSVLFPTIGALVTDTGGILSHPAIIAREFSLPAVVGTGNATSLVPDGAMVRVDGSAGAVELVA